jgi:hypothetical protein
MRMWHRKDIYSSWFKFKDYYKKKLLFSSKHDNSFGTKSYYTFNNMNTNYNTLDETKQYSYGQFHYFFQIENDFPDQNLLNTKLGCATLRDVKGPDYNNVFIDSIEVKVKNYWSYEEKVYTKTTTFDYVDHYFVDLNDVVPSRILTIGTDKDFKPIKKRQTTSSTNDEMSKYFSKNKHIHYLLFIESNSEMKNVMLN